MILDSEFIDKFVSSFNKSRSNKIKRNDITPAGYIYSSLQFETDIGTMQVVDSSNSSGVVFLYKSKDKPEIIKQWIFTPDDSEYTKSDLVKTACWVMSGDHDAYWDFEELTNTQQLIASDDDVIAVMKEFGWKVDDVYSGGIDFVDADKRLNDDDCGHLSPNFITVTRDGALRVELKSCVYNPPITEFSLCSNDFTYDGLRSLVNVCLGSYMIKRPFEWS